MSKYKLRYQSKASKIYGEYTSEFASRSQAIGYFYAVLSKGLFKLISVTKL